jgi:signal transduction histidine kinase
MKILLLEDNPADARLFEEYVNESSSFIKKLDKAESLEEALEYLNNGKYYNVIVSDLKVPDSEGLNTFFTIRKKAKDSAIVVLSGANDEGIALKAVEAGAQDYIFKNELNPEILPRLLKYADQRKKSEIQLIEAKEKAENLQKLQEQFVAMATHELRSPMNSILGFTEVLLEEETHVDKFEMLEIILNSSKKLLNHINNMLDMAKVKSGKMTLDETEFNIADSFIEVFNMQKGQVKNKDVFVKKEILQVNYQYVVGDRLKFEQIFTNLLTNALKFTDEGEVKVSLFDKSSTKDTTNVILRITDNGPGISEKEIQELFTPYHQIKNSENTIKRGTGLGMTVVDTFINMMNGKVKVSSKPNIGTTFLVEFPFKINLKEY